MSNKAVGGSSHRVLFVMRSPMLMLYGWTLESSTLLFVAGFGSGQA